MFIPDPGSWSGFYAILSQIRITDQGFKKSPYPGPGSVTLKDTITYLQDPQEETHHQFGCWICSGEQFRHLASPILSSTVIFYYYINKTRDSTKFIRGSGSTPKCHRSPTLFLAICIYWFCVIPTKMSQTPNTVFSNMYIVAGAYVVTKREPVMYYTCISIGGLTVGNRETYMSWPTHAWAVMLLNKLFWLLRTVYCGYRYIFWVFKANKYRNKEVTTDKTVQTMLFAIFCLIM
jgi:hypothetical protein